MLRLLLGANWNMLRIVASKYVRKLFKDNGLKSEVDVKDFVVYKERGEILIHISGDLRVEEKDLLDFLNGKLDAAE